MPAAATQGRRAIGLVGAAGRGAGAAVDGAAAAAGTAWVGASAVHWLGGGSKFGMPCGGMGGWSVMGWGVLR